MGEEAHLGRLALSIPGGSIGPRAAAHLLGRIGFGPRPGQVQEVLSRGLEKHALEQLEPAGDPELEARLAPFATLGWSIQQVLAAEDADRRSTARVLGEFFSAKLVRVAHAKNQLQEVLTDFWFNHFNVNVRDGFLRSSTPAYERDAIRPRALGRFRDLLGASAEHPAMLYYLDNYLSTVAITVGGRKRGGINENYGRELLELHTLGNDAGYDQQDVVDSARCFTGWGIENPRRSGAFVFRPQAHDRGAKSVYGLSLPAGGGKEDGDRLLDHLASQPATARRISSRLVQRFVADDPPAALVERCAGTFLRSDGDIGEVMKTILGSAEFWAEAFGPGKAKTPLELVGSAVRAVDAEVSNGRGLEGALEAMGMPAYSAVPPTGYTNRGVDWLNPSSQLAKINFGLDLATGVVPGVRVGATFGDDPRRVAEAFAAQILGGRVMASTLDTAARVGPGSRPSAPERAVALMLASPDFQVR